MPIIAIVSYVQVTSARQFRPCLDKNGMAYEDYFVSPSGEVLSAKLRHPFIRKPSTASGNNKGSNGNYYLMILRQDGHTYGEYVHHLVARAWIGFPSSPDLEVNHKDGNKKNNQVSNLEWVTTSRNRLHAIETGLKISKKGEEHTRALFTDNDIRTIRHLAGKAPKHKQSGSTMAQLARDYNCSYSAIFNIVSRKNWKHVA